MNLKNASFLLCGVSGDIVGSVYEFAATRTKSKVFDLFMNGSKYTDDTVTTIAIMKWLLSEGKEDLSKIMRDTCRNDLKRGYGNLFYQWIMNDGMEHYNSFGNGSAMRVAPVGWFAKSLDECLKLAKESAEITHNHPEGIKGAEAIASAIYLAKIGKSKEEIKKFIEDYFEYNLNRTLEEIRPNYKFNATCQGSVPESIICFLESTSFEDSIRNAISLGGDTDTMAAMSSAIAEAYYSEVPTFIIDNTITRLPKEYIDILYKFKKYVEENCLNCDDVNIKEKVELLKGNKDMEEINKNEETKEVKQENDVQHSNVKIPTIVVNLFGGPGSGKSTTCAGLFERLKLKGVNCEMATEYAKDKVWEESYKTLDDQIYVFGKQLHKINRLLNKVDIIITDSPLLNSIIYDKEKNEAFKNLVLDQHWKLHNVNVFIQRNEHYEQAGRMQTLEESKKLDEEITNMLRENNVTYSLIPKVSVDGKLAADILAEALLKSLNKFK